MEDTKAAIAIRGLEDLIKEYNQKITQLQFTIAMLKGDFNQVQPAQVPIPLTLENESGFPYQRKLKHKILYAFNEINKACHINTLNEVLFSYDKALESEKSAIRNTITVLKADGVLKSLKAGKANTTFVWGLSEWFIDDNTIKSEFMYNKELFE